MWIITNETKKVILILRFDNDDQGIKKAIAVLDTFKNAYKMQCMFKSNLTFFKKYPRRAKK